MEDRVACKLLYDFNKLCHSCFNDILITILIYRPRYPRHVPYNLSTFFQALSELTCNLAKVCVLGELTHGYSIVRCNVELLVAFCCVYCLH